jgi:hypothetical protein
MTMFGSQWLANPDSGDIPVTTNLFVHFRADLGVTKDGSDLVSEWADQSGNGHDLTSSGTKRPTLLSANLNGKDVLDFDGSDDNLIVSSLSLAQPIHVFIVAKVNTWTSNDVILGFNPSTDMESFVQNGSSPQLKQRAGEDFINAISPTLGTAYLMQSLWNGSSSSQALNNDSAVTGGDGGTLALTTISVGAKTASTQYADCTIAELAIYSSVQTGDDLASLKSYFNTRYSLY